MERILYGGTFLTNRPISNDPVTKERKVPKSAMLAGAALALPFAANADIIFDPTQEQTISADSGDTATGYLTVGGVNEFLFTANLPIATGPGGPYGTDTVASAASGAEYLATISTNNPAPLTAGTIIGPSPSPGLQFQTSTGTLQKSAKLEFVKQFGPWPNDPNTVAYFGVEFVIYGDVHYGWVGLIACTPDDGNNCGTSDPSTIQITGFAYQGAANTPIAAGAGAVPEPSLLPLLALGAVGLTAFRARRKRAV
jgi:hypothetical protein